MRTSTRTGAPAVVCILFLAACKPAAGGADAGPTPPDDGGAGGDGGAPGDGGPAAPDAGLPGDPRAHAWPGVTMPGCDVRLDVIAYGREISQVTWQLDGPGSIEERSGAHWYVPPASVTGCVEAKANATITGAQTWQSTAVVHVCAAAAYQIQPATATASLNGQIVFTVSGIPGLASPDWAVNGVRGGTPTAGFAGPTAVAGQGLYIAPPSLPPVGPVRVTVAGNCQGAPSAAVTVEDVSVQPGTVVSRAPGETATLRLLARRTDGTSDDITSLATTSFASDSPEIATTSGSVVTAGEVGETFVVATDARRQPPMTRRVRVRNASRLGVRAAPATQVSALPGEILPIRFYVSPQRGPSQGDEAEVKAVGADFDIAAVNGVVFDSAEPPSLAQLVAGVDPARRRIVVGEQVGTAVFTVTYKPDGTTAQFSVRTIALEAVPWASRDRTPESAAPRTTTQAVISPVPEHPLDGADLRVLLRVPAGEDPALLERYGPVRGLSSAPVEAGDAYATPPLRFEVVAGGAAQQGYLVPMNYLYCRPDYDGTSAQRLDNSLPESRPPTKPDALDAHWFAPFPQGTANHVFDLHAGACAVVVRDAPLTVRAVRGGLLRQDVTFTVQPRFPKPEVTGADLPWYRGCPNMLEPGEWVAPDDIESRNYYGRRLLNDGFVGGWRLEARFAFPVEPATPVVSPRGQVFFAPMQAGTFPTGVEFRAAAAGTTPMNGPWENARSMQIFDPPSCDFVSPPGGIVVNADTAPLPEIRYRVAAANVRQPQTCTPSPYCGGQPVPYWSGGNLDARKAVRDYGAFLLRDAAECGRPATTCCDSWQTWPCADGDTAKYVYESYKPIPHFPAAKPGGWAWVAGGSVRAMLISSGEGAVVSPRTLFQATDRAAAAWDDVARRPPDTEDPRVVNLEFRVSRPDDLPDGVTEWRVRKYYPATGAPTMAVTAVADIAGGKRITTVLPPATLARGATPSVPNTYWSDGGDWVVETPNASFSAFFRVAPAFYATAQADGDPMIPLNAKAGYANPPSLVGKGFGSALPATLRIVPSRRIRVPGSPGVELTGACFSPLRRMRGLPLGDSALAYHVCPSLERAQPMPATGTPPPLFVNRDDLLLVDPYANVFEAPLDEPGALTVGADGTVTVTDAAALRPDGLPDFASTHKGAERIVLLQGARLLDVQPFTLFAVVGLAPDVEPSRWSGGGTLTRTELPKMLDSDPKGLDFWREGESPIAYHVDSYLSWWKQKPDTAARAHLFDGSCAYSLLERGRLDLCRDPLSPSTSVARVEGTPTGGWEPFGWELDGFACDPRWQAAFPWRMTCNSAALFAEGGTPAGGPAYTQVPVTAEGLLKNAGGASGGFARGGHGRFAYELVAETPGANLPYLDVAYLPWHPVARRPEQMSVQCAGRDNPLSVRFSEDDDLETSGEPDRVVTAGVAFTGPKAYVELTTLPRDGERALDFCVDGAGGVCRLNDAAFLLQYVPDERPRPVQLDAFARADRKQDAPRIGKQVMAVAVDLGCGLATGGTISVADVAWAVASPHLKDFVVELVERAAGTDLDGPATDTAWDAATGVPRQMLGDLFDVEKDTSFLNAAGALGHGGYFRQAAKSAVASQWSAPCSSLIDVLILSRQETDDLSSAQAAVVETLAIRIPDDIVPAGEPGEASRVLVVSRPFSTGTVVSNPDVPVQQTIRYEDAGFLSMAFRSSVELDAMAGRYRKPGGEALDVTAGAVNRLVAFRPRIGGTSPTRFPVGYSVVAAAGRHKESGSARAWMRRSGRFVLVPLRGTLAP